MACFSTPPLFDVPGWGA